MRIFILLIALVSGPVWAQSTSCQYDVDGVKITVEEKGSLKSGFLFARLNWAGLATRVTDIRFSPEQIQVTAGSNSLDIKVDTQGAAKDKSAVLNGTLSRVGTSNQFTGKFDATVTVGEEVWMIERANIRCTVQ